MKVDSKREGSRMEGQEQMTIDKGTFIKRADIFWLSEMDDGERILVGIQFR